MNNKQKNALYSLILIIFFVSVYFYRQSQNPAPTQVKSDAKSSPKEVYIEGVTMGVVSYHIKYLDDNKKNYKKQIDSVLKAFNQALSTYIPDSEISRFNQGESIVFESPFFYPVLERSQEVFEVTKGAFDPTVGPLIEVWGFGKQEITKIPEPGVVDSLKNYVGMDKINFDKQGAQKEIPQVQLNFSAIAKGYAVDVVADYLKSQKIENYLVEIGREVACKGKNAEGKNWSIGIMNPKYKEPQQDQYGGIVQLENRALATSGNYENFYIKDGKKYAHTIDPSLGAPVEHALLSASVFASDCMTADAYATAFMVLGKNKALEIVEKDPNLDAFLIFTDEDGAMQNFVSEGIKDFFRESH